MGKEIFSQNWSPNNAKRNKICMIFSIWKWTIRMSRPMTKLTKWHVRPAKTQISLGVRPVWSVFAVHMKKARVLSYPLRAQRRLWSDWADAQADLSLRWPHTHFVGFVMSWLIYSMTVRPLKTGSRLALLKSIFWILACAICVIMTCHMDKYRILPKSLRLALKSKFSR